MKRTSGFTLIELMIAIVLMGILILLGLPTFGTYMNNALVRSTTESFFAGLQTTRAEAIRRNASVDFVLTNETDNLESTFDVATPNANGQGWLIRTNDLTAFIEGKHVAEGSNRTAAEASAVQITSTVTVVTFNSLGVTVPPGSTATIQFVLSNPADVLERKCVMDGGPIRCLNVTVSTGGQSRICDPAVSASATAAGDTRGC